MKLCVDKLFRYYFLMCPTEHPWVDFEKIFEEEEKAEFITLGFHVLGELKDDNDFDFSTIPVMLVCTNLNRVFLFKPIIDQLAGHIDGVENLYCFYIRDIEDIKYDISLTDLPIAKYQSIPVSLSITLKTLKEDLSGPLVLRFPTISTVAETLIEKLAFESGVESMPQSMNPADKSKRPLMVNFKSYMITVI